MLEVAAAGGALNSAQQLAERIAKTSRASVAAIKRTVHAAWNLEPSQIDALEEAAFPKLFGPEQSARMDAFLKSPAGSTEPLTHQSASVLLLIQQRGGESA